MEELIAKFLPEELKERRRLYEEEMEELSKYAYAHCCTFPPNSSFSDTMLVAWNWPQWEYLHRRNRQTL